MYRDDEMVLLWAVDAHAGADTDVMARAFARKMRLGLPIAFTESANAARLGVDGYPTLVLLDATGRIRYVHDGYDGSERIESNLAEEISAVLVRSLLQYRHITQYKKTPTFAVPL